MSQGIECVGVGLFLSFGVCYELNCVHLTPNLYVEALTPESDYI